MTNMLRDKKRLLSNPAPKIQCDLHICGHADPVKVFFLKLFKQSGISFLLRSIIICEGFRKRGQKLVNKSYIEEQL